jgi:hypothetical protein
LTSYVWYAAYGSNLHADRLGYYIGGGTPPGTDHVYPGFRDQTPPVKTTPLTLPGTIYFAWQSPVWTGGVAFYAHQPASGWPRGAAARGYLITTEQFTDLRTQEMYRMPGDAEDLDLDRVLRDGSVQLGEGRYETLVHVGDMDGMPILTFTSPWNPTEVALKRPSPRYLSMISTGLRESHEWPTAEITSYLSRLPGVQAFWPAAALHTLVREAVDGHQPIAN